MIAWELTTIIGAYLVAIFAELALGISIFLGRRK
jgi:hypothetical protein